MIIIMISMLKNIIVIIYKTITMMLIIIKLITNLIRKTDFNIYI